MIKIPNIFTAKKRNQQNVVIKYFQPLRKTINFIYFTNNPKSPTRKAFQALISNFIGKSLTHIDKSSYLKSLHIHYTQATQTIIPTSPSKNSRNKLVRPAFSAAPLILGVDVATLHQRPPFRLFFLRANKWGSTFKSHSSSTRRTTPAQLRFPRAIVALSRRVCARAR